MRSAGVLFEWDEGADWGESEWETGSGGGGGGGDEAKGYSLSEAAGVEHHERNGGGNGVFGGRVEGVGQEGAGVGVEGAYGWGAICECGGFAGCGAEGDHLEGGSGCVVLWRDEERNACGRCGGVFQFGVGR